MLKFLKKIFAKEELQEESIKLNNLSTWVHKKSEPILEKLKEDIKVLINSINEEKNMMKESINVLHQSKLQNPNIPERAITIMEGNRAAFLRRVNFFHDSLDINFTTIEAIEIDCSKLHERINDLGKSTSKSYQVLTQFFAREAENVAQNIKNIETYAKKIKNSITNSNIKEIKEIKDDVKRINDKIDLKEKLKLNIKKKEANIKESDVKNQELEKKISELKSSSEYSNYHKLLEEKKGILSEINRIENQLFHDFSDLERAFKKYSKISFENEKMIDLYLDSPIKALLEDGDIIIFSVLQNLKTAINNDSLGLDQKKKSKTIERIDQLGSNYLKKIREDYLTTLDDLKEKESLINSNKAKSSLDSLNKELDLATKNNVAQKEKLKKTHEDLNKIDLTQLKDVLQSKINNIFQTKVTIH